MHFNIQGYLEPGIHDATLQEIDEHLVVGFPTSTTRPAIFAGYKQHRSELEKYGIAIEQLIDGSFVSTKNDPSDIDFVCFIDADSLDAKFKALPPAERIALHGLFVSAIAKAAYNCDVYLCPTVPESDPRYRNCRTARKYWLGEFGFDRQEVPKGVLRLFIRSTTGT